MKYILLSLILIAFQPLAHASHYQLSPESMQSVKNTSLIGGVIGGTLGLAAGIYQQDQNQSSKNKTTWEKIKSFPWHYAIIPAVLGAIGGGLVGYYFTPEKYLESAEKELNLFEHDIVLKAAINSNDVTDLKKLAFDSQYPTITIYGKVSSLLSRVRSAKDYLLTVINSGIKPLVTIAQTILERIKLFEEKLVAVMAKLKSDTSYHQELLTRERIQYMKEVAYHQGRRAAAAEMQAQAAWHAAHCAPEVAHIIPNSPHHVVIIK